MGMHPSQTSIASFFAAVRCCQSKSLSKCKLRCCMAFQPSTRLFLSGVIHLLLLFFPSICTRLGEGFSQLVQSRQINQMTPKRCLRGHYILCYTSAVLSWTSELLPWYMHQRQLVLAPHAYHEMCPCQVAPCKVEQGLSTKLTGTVSGTTLRTVVSSQLTDLPH